MTKRRCGLEWQQVIDEIRHRHHIAEQMGGPEAVAQQHAQGKLTARERIAALADTGSFQEIGGLAGSATYDDDKLVAFMPSPSVIGVCTVNGRKVAIGAGDCTANGEVFGTNIGYKMGHSQKLALEWHLPYIRLLDAPEGSVLEIDRVPCTYIPDNDTVDEALRLLGQVPVVSAIMGPVTGLPVIEASLSHFSVIVKDTGRIFLGSSPQIKSISSCGSDKEEIGSAKTATTHGVIDNMAENEEDAFTKIRQFLSYLPQNAWEMPPRIEPDDDPNRRDDELLSVIPEDKKKLYNPYGVLKHVLDHDSLFELFPHYGRSSITALARVNGYPVGVMIKNPMSSSVGSLDSAAGAKVIRFLQLCDTFHLPVVYFVDEPGFTVGLDAQKEAIVRAGARVVLTGDQIKVPWISFITRQLYGVAGCLFFRYSGMYRQYGWATANWGGMHVEGGAMAAYRRDIENAPDPEAKRRETENRLKVLSSIFRTAEAFEVEDIIDPRDTRPLLCDFIESAQAVLRTQLGPGTGPIYLP